LPSSSYSRRVKIVPMPVTRRVEYPLPYRRAVVWSPKMTRPFDGTVARAVAHDVTPD
jgi:hypothetical protein